MSVESGGYGSRPVLDVEQRPAPQMWAVLSLQHLFAMFGATVLVPLLAGLDPAVALVSSGLGTLLYILLTGGHIPADLGSSFAFIAPVIAAAEVAAWSRRASISARSATC